MTKTLILPVLPQVLLVEETRWGIRESYDFSRLPYTGSEFDIHPDTPFVAHAVTAPPFSRPDFPLEAGLHLHWLLPPFLRKTIPFRGLQQAAHTLKNEGPEKSHPFPPVPNRWAIARIKHNQVEREWILESDYLHAPETPPQDSHRFVTYPWFPAYDKKHEPPFRFLGRVYEKGHKPEGTGTHLGQLPGTAPLTAVGYGDPLFASYYPNCRSVFGFYDPDISTLVAADGLEYRITGYYSDERLNYWKQITGYLLGQDEFKELETEKAKTACLEEELRKHLQLVVELPGSELPAAIGCHARIKLNTAAQARDETVTVTIANSGTEAIAASLAHQLEPEQQGRTPERYTTDEIEDLLEAILMRDRLTGKLLDTSLKFREMRHEQEFYTSQGGYRWAVQSTEGQEADTKTPPLPHTEDLSRALAALNTLQQEYDRAHEQIRSRERHIFDLWYCYQLTAYRDEAGAGDLPEPDMLKDLIDTVLLPKINNDREAAGLLTITRGNHGEVIGSTAPAGSALAGRLAVAIHHTLEALPRDKKNGLYTVPGPRYYMPREPVICVSGDPLKGLLHDHGQADADGKQYQGHVLDIPAPVSLNSIGNPDIIQENKALARVYISTTNPSRTWNALMLDWKAEFFPVEGQLKPRWRADDYAHDYITANFDLKDNEPELTLKAGKGLVEEQPEVHEGRSLLNPFSQREVREKLLTWCQHVLETTDTAPQALRALIEKKYDNNKRLQVGLQLVVNALEALGIESTPRLTQSLSGFHHTLLARKSGWQLPVKDPLGFNAYQEFAARVQAGAGQAWSAPQPWKSFHPIRSGEMSITALRLIDSFGQYKDLPVGTVNGAEKMESEHPNRVRLPVRFLQGLRLHFRWLNGNNLRQESHDAPDASPVAGWILPEYLEQQLAVFDRNGTALGTLHADGWTPDPGNAAAPASHDQVADRALRAFCTYIIQTTQDAEGQFGKLLQSVKDATAHIEPETGEDAGFIASLFGQPLALAHASLGLELQGSPVAGATWEECWKQLLHPHDPPAHGGVSSVNVPVRIGEHHQLNDGVVWCWEWKQGDGGTLRIDDVRSPQIQAGDHFEINIAQANRHLGLLLHPLGSVHITTGVLPVKAVTMSVSHYRHAMRSLKGKLQAGPLLVPMPPQAATAPETPLPMPLPRLLNYQWKWIPNPGDAPGERTVPARWEPAPWRIPGKVTIREGWLQIDNIEEPPVNN